MHSDGRRVVVLLALAALAVLAIVHLQQTGLQLLALALVLVLLLVLLRRQQQQERLDHTSRQLDVLLQQLIRSSHPDAGAEEQPADKRGVPYGDIRLKVNALTVQLDRLLQSARNRSLVDELTQLPNRGAFLEQIQVESARAIRSSKPFAVLFVDVDQFRSLNDTYGHATGDRALIAVARKLKDTVRLGDFLARYGSDEFAVLMDLSAIRETNEDTLKARAYQFASRVVSAFSEVTDLGDTLLDIGVSVGVSVVHPGETDAEAILRNLDTVIQQAKRQKHERVAIFDVSSAATTSASLDDYKLFSELKEALRQRTLHMAFQPLVTGDGRWWSLEALARWQHPQLGFIPPDRFIAIAERYRLMRDLGDLIFQLSLEGFCQIREALHLPELRLSANISPSQLSDPDLHARLRTMLEAAGLTPELITLEITEASILESTPATEANLQEFRAQGYALALDDFGTGYSSLNLLNTLQPNEIKIDKSFVMALGSDGYAGQIVAVISSMAKHMDLHLVAEGVEDATVLRALQNLGIPLFQGYHFYRPMLPAALIAEGEKGA
ncbi:MAG: bifunctional diguanylate cyclase/phosphodiesterase [Cyanobacteriota bacterium]|nr:bifunctional diguanylate cyclase/phosphodiesterase [Cyanobacteriota bacterium]